jgi:hypothetical protein
VRSRDGWEVEDSLDLWGEGEEGPVGAALEDAHLKDGDVGEQVSTACPVGIADATFGETVGVCVHHAGS